MTTAIDLTNDDLDLTNWQDVLGDPAGAQDDRLTELHDHLRARLDDAAPRVKDKTITPGELGRLSELVPAYQAVTAEQGTRAEHHQTQLDSATAFYDQFGAADPAEPEGENADGAETESTEDSQNDGDPAAQAPATVAASGKRGTTTTKPRVPEIGTTAQHAPRQPGNPGGDHRMPITVTAAADLEDHSAGSTLGFDNIGKAMAQKMSALQTVNQLQGKGEKVKIATLRASGVPAERTLSKRDWYTNTQKMAAVGNARAITAAGGLCAPLEIDYSYQTVGSTGRPLRDALPTFQAERGGIMFRPNISPASIRTDDGPRAATGRWTNTDDKNAYATTNPPRKKVWIVDCPDVVTAEVEARTFQLEFSNVTSRFDPETVQANQEAALINHDRLAENDLAHDLRTASKTVVATSTDLGATRSLLTMLDKLSAYTRNVHRLPDSVPVKAAMAAWGKNLLRADMAKAMSLGDLSNLNITDAQLDSWLATRGLSPVWHMDGTEEALTSPAMAPQAYELLSTGDTVPEFSDQLEVLTWPEGHFMFLDGGTLDLGIVRDSELIDRNRYRQFSESWEGVAARGPEALRLVATIDDNGRSAGTV